MKRISYLINPRSTGEYQISCRIGLIVFIEPSRIAHYEYIIAVNSETLSYSMPII